MNFEQRNILSDLEVIKDKLDDLHTTHCWSGDDIFKTPRLKTKEERLLYSASYVESRIQHEQHAELLRLYVKELDNLIDRFKEEDKKEASSVPTDQSETENA